MGCFFELHMRTWADALLALSVMQAAASDIHERWQRMDVDAGAATLRLPNLPTLHQALTKATPTTHTGRRSTGSRGGLTATSESSMATKPRPTMANTSKMMRPRVVFGKKSPRPTVVRETAVRVAGVEVVGGR